MATDPVSRRGRDLDFRQGRDEIFSKVLLELSVKEPIRDAWIGCSQLQRTEMELGMKFPIVAHCRMQNGNCKRKCRQAQNRHDIRNAAKPTLESIKPVIIAGPSS